MDRLGTLLLVEDEHILRNLVAQFLRGASYRVVEAADGPDGVAQFRESGPFDLAILDLNLPGFSGVEVCRKIRQAQPDQNVLICSAAIVPEAEEALLAMGVDHFLTKPYHPEVLLAHVARVLRPFAPPQLSFVPGSATRP
jgi:DNA-binding response OmpR family regulator